MSTLLATVVFGALKADFAPSQVVLDDCGSIEIGIG